MEKHSKDGRYVNKKGYKHRKERQQMSIGIAINTITVSKGD